MQVWQLILQSGTEIGMELSGKVAEWCMSLHRLQQAKAIPAAVAYSERVFQAVLYSLEHGIQFSHLPS